MSGQKIVTLKKKGDELFKEGANPDAMYVIKKGRLAITKVKGKTKITLAELKPGDLLGEMAFFDKSPRSAGAQAAMDDTEVIELPFIALDQQWQSLPAWVKSIVKAINGHLRRANVRIRQLERTKEEETEMFPSHTINALMATLGLVTEHYGKEVEGGVEVPSGWLRDYTIQVYQLPTYKMSKLCEVMAEFGLMTVEDLGEDQTRYVVKDKQFIFDFVEFYRLQLFSEKAKKLAVNEFQSKTLRILTHYGKDVNPDHNGFVKVDVSQASETCEKDLGLKMDISDVKDLCDKGIVSEHLSEGGKDIAVFNFTDVDKTSRFWTLIHRLKSFQTD
jgi:CRP/FNR family transcriptional regulator, cyclic AMP receptor protein